MAENFRDIGDIVITDKARERMQRTFDSGEFAADSEGNVFLIMHPVRSTGEVDEERVRIDLDQGVFRSFVYMGLDGKELTDEAVSLLRERTGWTPPTEQ